MRCSLNKIFCAALGGYAALAASFALFQRRVIYFPPRGYPLTPAALGLAYEEVALSAADGVGLRAWWIPCPRDVKDGPVILFFHGNATNLSGLVDLAAVFVRRGCSFFGLDYRGYGASSGTPTEAGLVLDACAARDWLLSRGIPADRIVLYGHSLGAALAARLASGAPGTGFAGVVLEGSFPSIYAMARFHYPWLLVPPFLVRDRFETARWIRGARCPVLVVHGEKDAISPLKFGRTVFTAAPEPREFLMVPGAGHNDMLSAHPAVAGAVERFTVRGSGS